MRRVGQRPLTALAGGLTAGRRGRSLSRSNVEQRKRIVGANVGADAVVST